MPSINIDEEFLNLFYGITNSTPPKEVSDVEIKMQLLNIIEILKELNANAKKPKLIKALLPEGEEDIEKQAPAILLVDDLGVITYQLKVLLSQFDYDIDCSQEIYDAVNKYKKRKYDYVIMDLFIPTEREGFILLSELKKMATINGNNTIIGVITASPRKEIEAQCKARGADFFLEKSNDWQATLYNKIQEYINADSDNSSEEDDY